MQKGLIVNGLCLAICFFLVSCTSSDYKNATKLQEQGKYQQAIEIYKELKDYEDSASRITQCEEMMSANERYDKTKTEMTEKNNALDEAISNAEAIISKGEKALDETLISKLETSVSETKSVKQEIPEKPKTAKEINSVVDEMDKVDYTKAISRLSTSQRELEKSIKQYSLVNNPSEKYVIKCLKKINSISGISAVTEKNDPNGHLNKAGGYTAQVYFSSKWIDQGTVDGKTIIEKGTDCGGSIEVYKTEDEANIRKDYLSTFDGGIFASGSHTIVGTVLVRTSDELTASQQKRLENQIIKQLTKL